MKQKDSFPRRNDHSILLSEKLRRIRIRLREAESFVESEMAMRDLDKVIEGLEIFENQSRT